MTRSQRHPDVMQVEYGSPFGSLCEMFENINLGSSCDRMSPRLLKVATHIPPSPLREVYQDIQIFFLETH